MPFSSLLVPVDYGPNGDRALRVAAHLATTSGLPIEILTVTETRLDPADDQGALEQRIQSVGPVACTATVVRSDDISAALIEAFRARPDALPLIGTAAPGGLVELFGAGVWEGVLAATGRPALLVGPHADDRPVPDRLVVAVTEGSPTEPLAAVVSRWAETFGAAVSVVDVVGEGGVASSVAQHTLRQASDALRRQGVPATIHVVRSDHVAATLRERAEEDEHGPAVLVMVSGHWATPQRIHRDSTARDVVHHARVPVLVVPGAGAPAPVP